MLHSCMQNEWLNAMLNYSGITFMIDGHNTIKSHSSWLNIVFQLSTDNREFPESGHWNYTIYSAPPVYYPPPPLMRPLVMPERQFHKRGWSFTERGGRGNYISLVQLTPSSEACSMMESLLIRWSNNGVVYFWICIAWALLDFILFVWSVCQQLVNVWLLMTGRLLRGGGSLVRTLHGYQTPLDQFCAWLASWKHWAITDPSWLCQCHWLQATTFHHEQ